MVLAKYTERSACEPCSGCQTIGSVWDARSVPTRTAL